MGQVVGVQRRADVVRDHLLDPVAAAAETPSEHPLARAIAGQLVEALSVSVMPRQPERLKKARRIVAALREGWTGVEQVEIHDGALESAYADAAIQRGKAAEAAHVEAAVAVVVDQADAADLRAELAALLAG